MKYKFEVTYTPAPLAKAEENMSELFNEVSQAELLTTVEISNNGFFDIEVEKQNITRLFESDGFKVIKIEVNKVE
jgi:hypothetical protein